MSSGKQSLAYDLTLRASGIALAIVGAAAMRYLYHLVHVPPHHEASVLEMAVAAVGYIALSFGCGLTWLGAHIHDQVPISARWAAGAGFTSALRRRGSPECPRQTATTGGGPRGRRCFGLLRRAMPLTSAGAAPDDLRMP